MKEAYAISCNTIFIQLAEKIGVEKIIETAEKIGLGEVVGIELEEGIEEMKYSAYEIGRDGIGNFALGQKYVKLTPLQINNMTMIIANDGVKKDISIVKGYATNTGKKSQRFNREEDKWLIDSKYTNVIKDYMESVVEYGTASSNVNLNQYGGAAGKTGTAQTETDRGNNGLFTGYSPSTNPKYAVTVVIEAIGNHSSSSTAVVVFNEIMEKINRLENKN